MILYRVMLFVFIATVFAAAVNTMGIFDIKAPTQTNYQISRDNLTDITESDTVVSNIPVIGGLYDLFGMGKAVVGIIMGAINAMLSFPDLLSDYGIPSEIVIMLSSIFIFLAVFGLIKLLTNRQDKGIE